MSSNGAPERRAQGTSPRRRPRASTFHQDEGGGAAPCRSPRAPNASGGWIARACEPRLCRCSSRSPRCSPTHLNRAGSSLFGDISQRGRPMSREPRRRSLVAASAAAWSGIAWPFNAQRERAAALGTLIYLFSVADARSGSAGRRRPHGSHSRSSPVDPHLDGPLAAASRLADAGAAVRSTRGRARARPRLDRFCAQTVLPAAHTGPTLARRVGGLRGYDLDGSGTIEAPAARR
jgi:hypothetical protein